MRHATWNMLALVLSAPALEAGDFDGDGRDDLAVGCARDEVAGQTTAGRVYVLKGGAAGLATENPPALTALDFPGELAQQAGNFGAAVAGGDFDGDGFCDLAVGYPRRKNAAGEFGAGAVAEYTGGEDGLVARRLWTQDSASVAEKAEQYDSFGAALAVGDFNGDGRADLAVGVPFESVAGAAEAGAVHVLYGSKKGLSAAKDQLWHQNRPGVKDKAEAEDQFGAVLAAGDFDGDGRDDLAIGVIREHAESLANAPDGAIAILLGSGNGLRAKDNRIFRAADLGVALLTGATFPSALAAGDLDGDGRDELAIGNFAAWLGGVLGVGEVRLLLGAPGGLELAGLDLLHQDLTGIPSATGLNEQFGTALEFADFDADGFEDLAIGAPLDIDSGTQVGGVTILRGSASGWTGVGAQHWTQASPSIGGGAEFLDGFGAALAAGDFDGNGASDLAIGVPREDVGGGDNAGAVNVLYAENGSGLGSPGNQVWFQELFGGSFAGATSEEFGSTLGR